MAISFPDLVKAAQQLTPAQKNVLVQTLQSEPEIRNDAPLTRERALAELEALRASGAFENVESLRGKYARPGVEVSDDELNAYLSEIGREWEQDFDDLDAED